MGDCFEEEDSESMDFTSSSEGKEFDGVGRNTGNYSVMPLTAVMDFMKKSLEEVNSVIQLPNLTTLRHLANFYKWDKERLMEVYFEKSPAQLTSLTRLDISGNLKSPFKRKNLALTRRGKTSRREECSICLLEIPSAQLFGLRCEHRFCLACWKHYLRTQILNDGGGGGGGILTCPAHDCRLFVDDDTVLGFIAEELILKGKYLYLVTNQFVNSNRSLIWCPQPGCENVIQVKDADLSPNAVSCVCGKKFCFHCSGDLHDPVKCELLSKWAVKIRSGAESASWLNINTKPCPKCSTPIEKNGGCNHISCRSHPCTHQFCWICLGDWSSHNNNLHCNRFMGPASSTGKQLASKLSLERYLHYFNLWTAHTSSLNLEFKLAQNIVQKIKEMMAELGLSWVEAQFLQNAVDVLHTCRQTLIHTYVFAYYIERSNQAEIFEANQADLHRAVEELSGYLENDLGAAPLADVRTTVMNRLNYCSRRRNVLLSHINEGYERDWWTYTF